MSIWYHVRDLEAARTFYSQTLGFEEAYVDEEDRWARLTRGNVEVAIAEGDPEVVEAVPHNHGHDDPEPYGPSPGARRGHAGP